MNSRGDTIIEVIFATAVGGLIIVIAMAVMSRGVATAQMALEHTLVRQSLDGQADALRYIRDATDDGDSEAIELWKAIKGRTSLASEITNFSGDCDPPTGDNKKFYINTNGSPPNPPLSVTEHDNSVNSPFAVPGSGIWIEGVKPAGPNSPSFIDFHIQACWDPPFDSSAKAKIGTIVRLYD